MLTVPEKTQQVLTFASFPSPYIDRQGRSSLPRRNSLAGGDFEPGAATDRGLSFEEAPWA
jgi:hypothetical protein